MIATLKQFREQNPAYRCNRQKRGAPAPLFFYPPTLYTCQMHQKIITFLKHYWEYLLLALTLLTLTLFLMGHNLFGLSSVVASLLAIIGAVVGTILSLIAAFILLPLIGLAAAAIATLTAAVMVLLSLLVGGIFAPIIALLTTAISSILTWLAGTWLGTLLAPIYTTLTPLLAKVLPWFTTTKYGYQFYDWLDDQPWFPQQLVLTPKRKPKQKRKPKTR